MIVLTLRTDNPEAEVGLYKDNKKLGYKIWHAHRELAETLHTHLNDLLTSQKLTLQEVGGIVCYKGPGSFTGLRIGLTVANTLAYSLSIPIVGETDDRWVQSGIQRLLAGKNEEISLPEYGQEPHITQPKK
jgi:tRNA threonylcarbamoyladenosine biosynthesis protein TsaB